MWPISCSPAPTDAGARLQFEPPSAPVVGELSLNFCWKGFLLALLGAVGGLLIAWWGIDLLRVFGPQDVPRIGEIAINAPVWTFTFGAAVLSTLLFALIPALQVTRPNVNESLQEGSRGAVGPESHRLRALLVISQVALSLLLLAVAGLLIKSFAKLRATKPRFDPSNAVTLHLVMSKAKYPY